MIRNILALFVGIAVAIAVVGGIEWLSHEIFGAIDSVDMEDKDALRDLIASLPVGAILVIGLAWMSGAFAGSLVAGTLGTLKPHHCVFTVSGLILAGAITNLLLIPHPLWFSIVSPIGIVVAGFAALQILKRRAA